MIESLRRGAASHPSQATGAAGLVAAFVMTTLALLGCGRDGVTRYEVPKEAPPTVSQRPMAPRMGLPSAPKPTAPTYTLPAGWTAKAAAGMRLISLAAGKGADAADVSVVTLSGSAGGIAPNFNRWRRQVGLPPMPTEALLKILEPITVGGQQGQLGVFVGKDSGEGARGVIAGLVARQGLTWFFKMSGSASAIQANTAAFRAFLASVRFQGGAPAGRVANPPGPAVAKGLAGGARRGGTPQFALPPGWTAKPASGMRLISLMAGAGATVADVSVVSLPGPAGGLSPNFNRWRRQVGLPPLAPADLTAALEAITVDGQAGHLGVMSNAAAGAPAKSGVAAALISRQGKTWFFKLATSAEALKGHLPAFRAFLASVRFEAGAAPPEAPPPKSPSAKTAPAAAANPGGQP